MNTFPEMSAAPEYKDRSTSLMVFGILQILLAGFCCLFMLLMFFAMSKIPATAGQPGGRGLLPAVGVYGVLALVFISLGIGTIQAKRWARALSLVLGWSWLTMGLLSFLFLGFVFRQIMQSAGGGSTVWIGLIITSVFLFAAFILMPLAFVVFFQNRNVKATCEARDPVVRWTDACPLPVLGMALWIGFGAIATLLMPIAYKGVVPFFGTLLSGVAGSIVYLVFAAVWGYAAIASYKLKLAGWWICVAGLILFSISNAVTFMRIEPSEMWQRMGYSEAQIQQISQAPFAGGRFIVMWSVFFAVPLLGYLFWVKKFFKANSTPTVEVA